MASKGGGFTCCVPGCFSNSRRDKDISFYVIPADGILRKKWIGEISRKGFTPTDGHRVCSMHFEGGKKTYMNNIPTIFPLEKSHKTKPATPRRPLIRHTPPDSLPEPVQCPASSAEDSSETRIQDMKLEIERLREELQSAERIQETLEIEKSKLKFGLKRFQNSDQDMNYYVGMTYAHFKALYKFLDAEHGICSRLNYWGSDFASVQMSNIGKKGQKRSINPMEELFITVCRLRVNIPEKVLSDSYGISVSEVSRIFATWIDVLYSRLVQLPIWATKETIQKTMPEAFKQKYPLTRIIIDCTEIFIEKPSCFRAQSETYSTYKSHNTAKALVGIAPNGAVTFLSDLYGGYCSDKVIVQDCGIVDKLEEGDSVMADRGFEIQDLLAPKKVYLNIPPFMRSKVHLNPDEEDETREIASVRIHVERAIERVKNYNILKQIFPNSMSEDLGKIWKVCCYLTNFKGPLVV